MKSEHFLFEIGCEELPADIQVPMSEDLTQLFASILDEKKLAYKKITPYSTPRRLACLIEDLSYEQPSQTIEKKGPNIKAAFDADGKPTPACQGFAQSVGAAVKDLTTITTPKGEWLIFQGEKPGEKTIDLLPDIIAEAIKKLPLGKKMTWEDTIAPFPRPVRWIVAMYGKHVVPTVCFGLQAGSSSRGHRVHHPEPVAIKEPGQYLTLLKSVKVLADRDQRQKTIINAIEKIQTPQRQIMADQGLLDEVTNLVEWPRVHLGGFDDTFLSLPDPVLITAMKKHQKYFSVVDAQGRLLPEFITVANIVSSDKKRLVQGNERVLSARLADAYFFYEKDLATPPEAWLTQEKRVIFQKGLGSIFDKSERIAQLAKSFAKPLDVSPEIAHQTGLLCKFDLMTDMVGEFPTLQGIVGHYYAQHHQLPQALCQAIHDHYRPCYAGDTLPSTPLGSLIALADKIDSVQGLFAIGKIPSGTKDPFALRRQALGIVRILIENSLDLDCKTLLEQANTQLPAPALPEVIAQSLAFCMERFKHHCLDQKEPAEIIEALLKTNVYSPYDLTLRLNAIKTFLMMPEAPALASANKRIDNILKKNPLEHPVVQETLLTEPQEKQLFATMKPIHDKIQALLTDKAYTEILQLLATLKTPVDDFFDNILVMADNPDLRQNRLALLHQLAQLCRSVMPLGSLTFDLTHQT
jgi:glycyl-tRNA synthetase beta chain